MHNSDEHSHQYSRWLLLLLVSGLIILSAIWLWRGIEKHTQSSQSQAPSSTAPPEASSNPVSPLQDAGGRDAYRQFESQGN